MPDAEGALDAAGGFIDLVGFPIAVAVIAIVLGTALLWYQRKQHLGELERMAKQYADRTAEQEHRRIDHETAARVWQQLYESEKAERQANGREVSEQLKTLDLAIDLVQQVAQRGRK